MTSSFSAPTRTVLPLRVYRTARGLSQASLGELAGLDKRSICRFESGVLPSRRSALAIALVLGVPPEALFPSLAESGNAEAPSPEGASGRAAT